MTPLVLQGSRAYFDFRIASLLEKIRKVDTTVAAISAHYVFFINYDSGSGASKGVPGNMSKNTLTKAVELLGHPVDFNEKQGFFVTPRKGTISMVDKGNRYFS